MPKSDKELADELDARDRLTNRGYKQATCPKCNGYGACGSVQCWKCEGKGYYWEPPLMKELITNA